MSLSSKIIVNDNNGIGIDYDDMIDGTFFMCEGSNWLRQKLSDHRYMILEDESTLCHKDNLGAIKIVKVVNVMIEVL